MSAVGRFPDDLWTIEYREADRGPWIPTGIQESSAAEAWHTFTIRVMVRGLDYVMAQAFGPPRSLASIAEAA